jgi:plasmid stability protein
MTNLTLALDDAVVRQARVRAITEGTSLSAKMREFLQSYGSGTDDSLRKSRAEASARLMATIDMAALQTQPEPVDGTLGANTSNRRTLREALYADDFRAQDRSAA